MDVIAGHAERHPERAALIEGDRRLSWAELRDARNRLAHSLVGLGILPGEHVVLYAHNGLEELVASAAVRAAGAISVPMNATTRALLDRSRLPSLRRPPRKRPFPEGS